MHVAKGARGEGKKIGADGTSFGKDCCALAGVARGLGLDRGVGNDGPVFRSSELKAEAAFQVGLIETGKSHFGVHGNKKRVEVLGVVVFVLETSDGFSGWRDGRGEIETDHIFTGMNHVGRQLDVAVIYFCCHSDAVNAEVRGGAFTEVEQNGAGGTCAEAKLLVAGGGRRMWNKRKAKLIANIRDLDGTLASQVTWNAIGRRGDQTAGCQKPKNGSKKHAHRGRNLHDGRAAGKGWADRGCGRVCVKLARLREPPRLNSAAGADSFTQGQT